MNAEQLKDLLTNLLGPDGLDLKKDGTNWRELSIVKIELFHGKENEDPYE